MDMNGRIFHKRRIIRALEELVPSMLGIRQDKVAGKFEDESANLLKKLRTNRGSLKHLVWRIQVYLSVAISDGVVDQIITVGDLFKVFTDALEEAEAIAELYKPNVLTVINGGLMASQFISAPG